MKRNFARGLLTLLLVLSLLAPGPAALAAETIRPTNQALSVDGAIKTCEVYNIGDLNYFRLRDLAYLLNGTGSQFAVGWDGATGTVTVTRGAAYTPDGSELVVRRLSEAELRKAGPSPQPILINGAANDSLRAYLIGDYNFFNLRDLGKVLGFDVDYDTETRTMLVMSRPKQSAAQPASAARLGPTADAGREYLDKIVFLGDSTTYGFIPYYNAGYTALPKPEQVWTPKVGYLTLPYYKSAKVYLRATGEELSIADAAAKVRPEIMIITLGVDGIAFVGKNNYGKDDFISVYKQLIGEIQTASPDTKIILNSIYPVADSYQNQGDINNTKINDANGWIESIAVELGLPFLYSWETLAVNGRLPESAHNGDGLHLTGESLAKIAEYVRTHACS